MPVSPLDSDRMGTVMGILNVTPDSFSDGGRFLDHVAALEHGRQLIDEGASIVDVGGESTRPGAAPVGVDEELARVLPVVAGLADDVRVSIDTRHEAVARAAVASGASMVNDVSAGLGGVAAELGVGWVAMHMLGDPRTMQDEPRYDDVVAEVRDFLVGRAERAADLGVSEVWIDPGIGFGKLLEHNLALLRDGAQLRGPHGLALLWGVSRKSMFKELLGQERTEDRLSGTLAVAAHAHNRGVDLLRVHDVAEHADLFTALKELGREA